jgi:hypothetical protein
MLKGPRNAAALFRAPEPSRDYSQIPPFNSLNPCHCWIYAYKIDYVNYITPLIVEKLILSTPPLPKTKPIGGLEPPPEKALQPNCSEQ